MGVIVFLPVVPLQSTKRTEKKKKKKEYETKVDEKFLDFYYLA